MPSARASLKLTAVLVYVAVVLAVDTLAAQGAHWGRFSWSVLCWRTGCGVDLFKLTFWFVVPFLCSLRAMDWGYLGFRRWKRVDIWCLVGMMVLGGLAVLAIPFFPSLRATYSSMGHIPTEAKLAYAVCDLGWTLSWLVGWEFMHRYFLLRPVRERWPRYGWLLVPLSEGLYHLQKPPIEALGMVAFSLLATQWTLRRRNLLLPLLAHFFIEMALVVFLLVG